MKARKNNEKLKIKVKLSHMNKQLPSTKLTLFKHLTQSNNSLFKLLNQSNRLKTQLYKLIWTRKRKIKIRKAKHDNIFLKKFPNNKTANQLFAKERGIQPPFLRK